jgi:hypothetical protein
MPDAQTELDAPTVRLAHDGVAQGGNVLQGIRGCKKIPESLKPALLISYVYLKPFLKKQSDYVYRNWALDSGAFSAHNKGSVINLQDYIDTAKELLAKDSTLVEVFSLDVIGDWKASLRNTEKMWRQGVPAIPCYHHGEPWNVLKGMAKDYPKIALGGVAMKFGIKNKFAEQCFARVWPKRMHGFGYGSEKSIMALPWDSVDATNWEVGPCKYGRWNQFGQMTVKGSRQNLQGEVEYYLKLEKRARAKFGKLLGHIDGEHITRLSIHQKTAQNRISVLKR